MKLLMIYLIRICIEYRLLVSKVYENISIIIIRIDYLRTSQYANVYGLSSSVYSMYDILPSLSLSSLSISKVTS